LPSKNSGSGGLTAVIRLIYFNEPPTTDFVPISSKHRRRTEIKIYLKKTRIIKHREGLFIRLKNLEKINFGGGGKRRERRYRRLFYLYIFLLIHQKFCSNIFKSKGEALNLKYNIIKVNLKKMTKSPRVSYKGKNF
jgi:hypothetical protein